MYQSKICSRAGSLPIIRTIHMCATVSGANNGPVILSSRSCGACSKCWSPWAGMLLYSIPQNGPGSGPDAAHLFPVGDSYYYMLGCLIWAWMDLNNMFIGSPIWDRRCWTMCDLKLWTWCAVDGAWSCTSLGRSTYLICQILVNIKLVCSQTCICQCAMCSST